MNTPIDVEAEITGIVWKIDAAVGDKVAEGDPIVTMESMKMEIPISAPEDGEVAEILVAENDPVSEGQIVARLKR